METTIVNPLTQQPLSEQELSRVSNLGNMLLGLEAEIATIEALLEKKKEALNKIQKQDLPDAMNDVGLSGLTLSNGIKLEVVPYYHAAVNDNDPTLKEKALKWLRTNGAGALIKHEVKCALGTDAVKLLASLRGFLNKKQIAFKDSQTVHPKTLSKFMQEKLETGQPFPLDIFRAHHGKMARIAK